MKHTTARTLANELQYCTYSIHDSVFQYSVYICIYIYTEVVGIFHWGPGIQQLYAWSAYWLSKQTEPKLIDKKEINKSVALPSVMVALRCFTDAELLWQHAKISLPWQHGSVRANLNDTVKLVDLENPQFGTRIWNISPIVAEL